VAWVLPMVLFYLAAMYVGRGEEIIYHTLTYWASCLQVFYLGAIIIFADSDSKP